MKLNLTPISSNFFSYFKDTKSFSTEASTLDNRNFLSQIYDDAADRGFIMESSKTGKKETFYLVSVDEQDDEVCGWNFESTNGYKCLVIND